MNAPALVARPQLAPSSPRELPPLGINPGALSHIQAHARQAYPRECFGLLLTSRGEHITATIGGEHITATLRGEHIAATLRGERITATHSGERITVTIPVKNISPLPDTFLAEPLDLAAAEARAAEAGLQILGHYHSHPYAPPTPSAADKAAYAYHPPADEAPYAGHHASDRAAHANDLAVNLDVDHPAAGNAGYAGHPAGGAGRRYRYHVIVSLIDPAAPRLQAYRIEAGDWVPVPYVL